MDTKNTDNTNTTNTNVNIKEEQRKENKKEKEKEKENENEYVMYMVVNSDLACGNKAKMDKGKTAAQCCHSACRVTRVLETCGPKQNFYKQWLNNGEPKVVLKGTEAEMKELINVYDVMLNNNIDSIWCVHTIDQGRTQIPAGSLTTIAFRPMMRKSAPEIIKALKLL